KRGQGHVGYAFANSRAIITEDSRSPDVNNLVSAVDSQLRRYDPDTYVSFASIPIGPVRYGSEAAGVVVAPSDRAGRFTKENSRIIVHAAIALGNVLTTVESDLAAILKAYRTESTKETGHG